MPNKLAFSWQLSEAHGWGLVGVPVVLSANTGHRDVIRPDTCLSLERQTPTANPDGSRIGWMDSSVEELVEHLETLYTDRAAAQTRADRARAWMTGTYTWRAFAELCSA